jgi:hypothetical protein
MDFIEELLASGCSSDGTGSAMYTHSPRNKNMKHISLCITAVAATNRRLDSAVH